MRYIWRGIRLLIFWPIYIIVVIIGTIAYNFCSILWYFDLKHLTGIDNFWYPIEIREYDLDLEEKNGKLRPIWTVYDEYYKTPRDLLLNRKTRIYEKDETSTE